MQKLKFINAKNVEIDFTGGHYGVTDWSGLSNTGLDVQSQQTPFSDGSIYLDALLENREISVTVAMNDENNMSKRYEYRRELISALNPKLGEGYLIYENDFLSKRIKCIPQLPIIPNKNSDENGTIKISQSFTCCNPYWEDLEETTEIIGNNERAYIVNRGDIPAQIKAEILTTYAKNPRLVNFTTDKNLGLSGEINKDVFINTNQGEKGVYSENIVYQLDLLAGYLDSVTYSETQGKFIAVGYSGIILQSADGINWSSVRSGTSNWLGSVTYSETQGKFIAVGFSGTILQSTDGLNWSSVRSGTSSSLDSVTYSETQGKFIAVGENGTILQSTDGLNWSSVTSGVGNNLYSVTYSEAQGKFIAVGENGTILQSTDGLNWLSVTSGTSNYLDSVTYSEAQRKFIAVGYGGTILQSTDGLNWLSVTSGTSNYLDSVTYSEAQRKFIAVGYGGTILQSTDGINWSSVTSGVGNNLYSVTYTEAQGKFIAVGDSGTILQSTDGINWSSVTSGVRSSLESVTYSETQGKFIAVGFSGTILQSTDGLNWSSQQLSGIFYDSVLVDGTLHIVGSMIIHSTVDIIKQENLINRVTTDSDINLNLDIGENELALIKSGGNASVKLTFRNKYVGL